MSDEREDGDVASEGAVLSVHFGRAASCSSVGSVIDVLFLSSVAGAAVLSTFAVLLARSSEASPEEPSGAQPEQPRASAPEDAEAASRGEGSDGE